MATHKDWGEQTTGLEAADAFAKQIQGKTIVITGVGPKSLGEAMAYAIASQSPAHLILASRTRSKIEAVVSELQKAFPDVAVDVVVLDLSSQESIRLAAAEVNSLVESIDVLINNAGVMVPTRSHTKEGLELQFGTNHVGSWLFTNLLLDRIKAAARNAPPGETRVVNVTSQGHRISPIRFSDYNIEKESKHLPAEEAPPAGLPPAFLPKDSETYSGFVAYGQSKTGNVLTSLYLTEKLGDQGIVSYAVHPGSVETDLSRNLDPELEAVIKTTGPRWKTLEYGAPPMLVAAFDPALNKSPGHFLFECQIIPAADHASDIETADRLWKLSEELVGQKFDLGD